jgi:hypothetical protein
MFTHLEIVIVGYGIPTEVLEERFALWVHCPRCILLYIQDSKKCFDRIYFLVHDSKLKSHIVHSEQRFYA